MGVESFENNNSIIKNDEILIFRFNKNKIFSIHCILSTIIIFKISTLSMLKLENIFT